ncbi:methionyl-tRNA formyltransferase [Silvanigrella aquatica]|uniref:Methionyl-tRNA formyltransferase n=1 Tax=Silvanigrella aquatica TaxID=1915309 RepID=A0A1L4CY32_9BACT|nr:methionyl-tRNA formyltransferase [Silvanigrella aquatica]APJ02859.1 methionyl-tRNA formyltransferase [Silvanigrella aquatica]
MVFLQSDNRKKVVFLGTPHVAALALKILLEHESQLKIVLVVSQPPARSTRNGSETPSPVHELALSHGIPVLTPQTAKDQEFINDLKILQPDLCITAAYGNYLPKDFLSIPKYGTLNIHPSLLPLYRGAAPVQRCLENGDSITGVSLLLSVAAMDAGPLVAQEKFDLNHEIKAPDLLNVLFEKGAHLLVKSLPKYFLNPQQIVEQDHSKATKADKIKPEEGILNFSLPALALHNKVRAFAGWPGTKSSFSLNGDIVDLKIIATQVSPNSFHLEKGEILFTQNALCVCCGDNEILEILEMQLPGKKAVSAKDFQNGVKGKCFKLNK